MKKHSGTLSVTQNLALLVTVEEIFVKNLLLQVTMGKIF